MNPPVCNSRFASNKPTLSQPCFDKQRCLFKAYDIRGAASLFEPHFAYALAQTFATHYQNSGAHSVAVAYDTRQGSATIAAYLADALECVGIPVYWLGLATTPMMVYWANQNGGCGIIATASHSAKGVLGVKWLTHHHSPSRHDILQLYDELCAMPADMLDNIADNHTMLMDWHNKKASPVKEHYTAALHQLIQSHLTQTAFTPAPTKLANTLIVDCLDGATAVVAEAVFKPWVNQLIVLNTCIDGQFCKGNPDPAEPHRLHELSQAVLAHKADLGLAFDGDGDRLAVIDGLGRLIGFDELLYFLARASLMNSTAPSKILFDVKCLHTLPMLLHQYNANITAIMTKTGSSHLRRQLNSSHQNAVFAGELSGHFIFNDGKFINHDDGIYAAVRLLLWLTHQNQPLHLLSNELPKPIATPDLYFALPPAMAAFDHPHGLVDKLIAFADGYVAKQSTLYSYTIDGLRLDFCPNGRLVGFGLIRPSNTSHHLTLRFGADTQVDFDKLLDAYYALLLDFANTLPTTQYPAMIACIDEMLTAIKNSVSAHPKHT